MLDELQSRVLESVPVQVNLGRVYAPKLGVHSATTDHEGRLEAYGLDAADSGRHDVLGRIELKMTEARLRLPLRTKFMVVVGALLASRRTLYGLAIVGVLALGASSLRWSASTSSAGRNNAAVDGPDAFGQPLALAADAGKGSFAPSAAQGPEADVVGPDEPGERGPVPKDLLRGLPPLNELPRPLADRSEAASAPTAAEPSRKAERPDPMIALQEVDASVLPVAKPAVTGPATAPAARAEIPAPVAARVAAAAASSPVQAASVPATRETLTWKFGHLGIATITRDGVVIAGRGAGVPQRLVRAGDKLPDGSVLLGVDASSGQLQTDRALIQLR